MPAPAAFAVDDMVRYGWILLGENPREIVLGQIGRPWEAAGTSRGPAAGPARFAAFGEPGYAKIAFSLWADPHGAASSILTMETRVALTDPGSRRRFRRYWMIIGPFSGLIRRMAMRSGPDRCARRARHQLLVYMRWPVSSPRARASECAASPVRAVPVISSPRILRPASRYDQRGMPVPDPPGGDHQVSGS